VGETFNKFSFLGAVNCTKMRLAAIALPRPPSRNKGRERRGRKGLGIERGRNEGEGRT